MRTWAGSLLAAVSLILLVPGVLPASAEDFTITVLKKRGIYSSTVSEFRIEYTNNNIPSEVYTVPVLRFEDAQRDAQLHAEERVRNWVPKEPRIPEPVRPRPDPPDVKPPPAPRCNPKHGPCPEP